ncbi:MAG: hypothetical protein HMLKMBBP_00616 [Planctomycetes bacterium]|nr:hypothetical protein [Planctomycetota bacterium]
MAAISELARRTDTRAGAIDEGRRQIKTAAPSVNAANTETVSTTRFGSALTCDYLL